MSPEPRYCVIFISKFYAKKLWTNHEKRSAQARAFNENKEYILPARMDGTKLPGVLDTTGYINLSKMSPSEFAEVIIEKLQPERFFEFQRRSKFLPPVPDKLYVATGADTEERKKLIYAVANRFMASLERLSILERKIVGHFLSSGCPHNLPRNFHISMDLLRRLTGLTNPVLEETILGMSSVGYEVQIKRQRVTKTKSISSPMIFLEWYTMSPELHSGLAKLGTTSTALVSSTIEIMRTVYCEDHIVESLVNMNFSSLSTATTVPDIHMSKS